MKGKWVRIAIIEELPNGKTIHVVGAAPQAYGHDRHITGGGGD